MSLVTWQPVEWPKHHDGKVLVEEQQQGGSGAVAQDDVPNWCVRKDSKGWNAVYVGKRGVGLERGLAGFAGAVRAPSDLIPGTVGKWAGSASWAQPAQPPSGGIAEWRPALSGCCAALLPCPDSRAELLLLTLFQSSFSPPCPARSPCPRPRRFVLPANSLPLPQPMRSRESAVAQQ